MGKNKKKKTEIQEDIPKIFRNYDYTNNQIDIDYPFFENVISNPPFENLSKFEKVINNKKITIGIDLFLFLERLDYCVNTVYWARRLEKNKTDKILIRFYSEIPYKEIIKKDGKYTLINERPFIDIKLKVVSRELFSDMVIDPEKGMISKHTRLLVLPQLFTVTDFYKSNPKIKTVKRFLSLFEKQFGIGAYYPKFVKKFIKGKENGVEYNKEHILHVQYNIDALKGIL